MKWLGQNGQIHEKVIGYGLRTVPVFTNMSSPKVADGSETRLFRLFYKIFIIQLLIKKKR